MFPKVGKGYLTLALKNQSFRKINPDFSFRLQIVKIYTNSYREICATVVVKNGTPVGGLDANGEKKIVEIDESKFGKIKYNRVSFLLND